MNYSRSVFGIVFVLIMVSGFTSVSFSEYSSPRVQLESGVLPEDIQCRDDRVLVLRTNGSPACVYDRMAEKLGWEIIETVKEQTLDLNVSEKESDEILISNDKFDMETNSDIDLVDA